MGGAQSIQKAQKNIGASHAEIDNLVRAIQQEGNAAVESIIASEWNKQEELCQKLKYQYVDLLKNHFPKENLQGAAVQLGLMVPDEQIQGNLTTQKTAICKKIADMYTWKIELIRKLQAEMAAEGGVKACFARERAIYQKLSSQLTAQKDMNQEKWGDAYKRMYKFNKDIKGKYAKMKGLMDKIMAAKTLTSARLNPLHRDVTTLAKDVDKLIAETRRMCDQTIDIDLREVRNLEAGGAAAPAQEAAPAREVEEAAPAQEPRPAPSVPGAAPPPYTVNVIYDFNAEQGDEISVKTGDIVELVSEEGDWIRVRKNGNVGLIPKNYTDIINKQ